MTLHDLTTRSNITSYSTPDAHAIMDYTSKPTRELSLIEKKRLQWSKEKEDEMEWFPFGKPGAGAPLYNQRSRKNSLSTTATSISSGNKANSDLEPKDSVSNYNLANGRFETVPRSLTSDNNVSNGTIPSPTFIQVQYLSGSVNGGAVPLNYGPALSAQSACLPFYQIQSPTALPTNSSVNNNGTHPFPSANDFLHQPTSNFGRQQNGTSFEFSDPKFYNNQQQRFYAPPQPLIIPVQSIPAVALSAALPQARLYEQQIFGQNNAANTPTVSTVNTRSGKLFPDSGQRAFHDSNSSADFSYTEHWTNQLPMWQISGGGDSLSNTPSLGLEQQNGYFTQKNYSGPPVPLVSLDSGALPYYSSTEMTYTGPIANNNGHVTGSFPSNFSTSTPIQNKNFAGNSAQSETPLYQQQMYKTQIAFTNFGQGYSKAPSSLSTSDHCDIANDFSSPLKKQSSLKTDKFGSDFDEKQERINQTKVDLEQQILEKRRKQLQELERERHESERQERERKAIEIRETRENEIERNKWKELKEEEERREEAIRDALEKARLEAISNRRAKLYRHASQSRTNEGDEKEASSSSSNVLSDSSGPPRVLSLTAHYPCSLPTYANSSVFSGAESAGQVPSSLIASSPSDSAVNNSSIQEINRLDVNNSIQQINRPENFAPFSLQDQQKQQLCHNDAVSPDDRPIKPMNEEMLKLLQGEPTIDEFKKSAKAGQDRGRRGRSLVRQSLRKSRSTEASKIAAVRRAESSERSDGGTRTQKLTGTPSGTASQVVPGSGTAPPAADTPCQLKEETQYRRTTPESRLASAATYVIKRDTIFPHKVAENTDEGLVLQKPKIHDISTATAKKERVKLATPILPLKNGKSEKDSDNVISTKLKGGKHRQSPAELLLESKTTAESITCDNPWGDQLGGLNPLLQPISTRKKLQKNILPVSPNPWSPGAGSKSSTSASVSPKDFLAELNKSDQKYKDTFSTDFSPFVDESAATTTGGNPLLQKINTRKNLKPQSSATAASSTRQNIDSVLQSIYAPKLTPKPSLIFGGNENNRLKNRASTDDLNSFKSGTIDLPFESNRNNPQNPLCRTFSLRIKQSERQSDMLKQLSSLKEQLKKSQKVVENTLLSKDINRKTLKDWTTKAPAS